MEWELRGGGSKTLHSGNGKSNTESSAQKPETGPTLPDVQTIEAGKKLEKTHNTNKKARSRESTIGTRINHWHTRV